MMLRCSFLSTTALLLLLLKTTTVATANIRLILVNSETDQDIMEMHDNMIIDTEVHGTHLTVRADSDADDDNCITFNLDKGKIRRSEREPPFVLAGKNKRGKLYDSASILEAGEHILMARPCKNGQIEKTARGHGKPNRKKNREPLRKPEKLPNNPVEIKIKPDGSEAGSGPLDDVNDQRELGRKRKGKKDGMKIKFEVINGIRGGTGYESVALPSGDVVAYDSDVYGAVNGELRKWHKITLAFNGPPASETGMTKPGSYRAPSTFADYRVDVLFTHNDSGKKYLVPGYYSGNGDAANTGAVGGNVWLCHFRPDEVGTWKWIVEFAEGTNVAQNGGGNPAGFFNGVYGSFVVADTDKTGDDLRSKGRLQYVGKHHLQFAETGEYFLKVGPDSPSNLLAYKDFDDTPNHNKQRKSFRAHRRDFNYGDPTWKNGKGREMIGAINYLSSKGMNVISVTLLSDDKNVFPYINGRTDNQLFFDISKLAQWEAVFDHAEEKGITLHIKFQDTDSDDMLGTASLAEVRKLFYREMISRFGHHLAVVWDLGKDITNVDHLKDRSAFVRKIDPYQSPIIVHSSQENDQLLGVSTINGASIETSPESAAANTHILTKASADTKQPWIVSVDQQLEANIGVLPDENDPDHDSIRKDVLWGSLMSGGSGVQYSFGHSFAESDLTLQNFRSRENMWDQSKYALDFFTKSGIPFWEMTNQDASVSKGNMCLGDADGTVFVVYNKGIGNSPVLDLPGTKKTRYSVKWYDPRNGGRLQKGSVKSVRGGTSQSIGKAPKHSHKDWIALVRCKNCSE